MKWEIRVENKLTKKSKKLEEIWKKERGVRERKRLVIICVGLLLLLHYLFECNKYQYPQRSPVIQFRCCYYYCHCRLLLLLLNAEEKETAETKMITFIFFQTPFSIYSSTCTQNNTTQVILLQCKAWNYFYFCQCVNFNAQKLYRETNFLIIMSTMNCF